MATLSEAARLDIWEPTPKEAATEYAEHEKIYAGFMHLSKWIAAHIFLDLAALYFLVFHENYWAFGGLLLIATALLGYAVVTVPRAWRKSVQSAPQAMVAGEPEIARTPEERPIQSVPERELAPTGS